MTGASMKPFIDDIDFYQNVNKNETVQDEDASPNCSVIDFQST